MNTLDLTNAELAIVVHVVRQALPEWEGRAPQFAALADALEKLEDAHSHNYDEYEHRGSSRGDREDFHSDG